MKIGIISDAHLFHRKAISPKKYKEILLRDFTDCDIIVDCGDLTDKSTIASFQLEELYQIFKDISKPTFLVAGNHDSLSDKSVANIIGLRSNVQVFNEPSLIEIEGKRLLFIPYTNDYKNMYKELERILNGEPADYIFSHLNASNNFYSDIQPDRDDKKLAKYGRYWFNGHIHNDGAWLKSTYLDFYNVGSCSSLTFGDTHIPMYGIFNNEALKPQLANIPIRGSLMHEVYRITDEKELESAYNQIILPKGDFNFAIKFNIPCTDDGLKLRQLIKDKISSLDCIKEISFSYIDNKKEVRKEKIKNKIEKVPLMEQLINNFESQSGIVLEDSVKGLLL